ncbi:hypothetical protein FE257_000008 [Aspergillus nanangensis]|uniref:Uncharacterized protein n=1 Tax=Aspergillus nanangensis TaxID=2582783 RepID=A0AAD4GZM0_ASPNN|nr:hypothetical protein FE257_000008 [Aspergillus nanangensis]
MKSFATVAFLLALVPSTIAATCNANEYYCGSYLMSARGWDQGGLQSQIMRTMEPGCVKPYESDVRRTLFLCTDGNNVRAEKACQCGCRELGADAQNDMCYDCGPNQF